jgi:hypothetical protein
MRRLSLPRFMERSSSSERGRGARMAGGVIGNSQGPALPAGKAANPVPWRAIGYPQGIWLLCWHGETRIARAEADNRNLIGRPSAEKTLKILAPSLHKSEVAVDFNFRRRCGVFLKICSRTLFYRGYATDRFAAATDTLYSGPRKLDHLVSY